MSDTPRTDKHEDGRIGSPLDLSEYERVLQFARTLERENAELLEALKDAQASIKALLDPEFNSPRVRMDIEMRLKVLLTQLGEK